jgi:5-methylcytosine-specific restriction endonuclease McrA
MNDKAKESASERMDRIVAESRRNQEQREPTYREQALKMYPWVCGRCGREFERSNLRELTVHHRDHNHDNNPDDGSNWELLCLYCHDNEHSRYLDHEGGAGLIAEDKGSAAATHNPFANLKDMLKGSE